jgi:hypothetical protein
MVLVKNSLRRIAVYRLITLICIMTLSSLYDLVTYYGNNYVITQIHFVRRYTETTGTYWEIFTLLTGSTALCVTADGASLAAKGI